MAVETKGEAGQVTAPVKPEQETAQPDSKTTEPGTKTFSQEEAAGFLKEIMGMKAKIKKIEAEDAKKAEADALAKGEFQKLHETAQAKLKAINERLLKAEIKSLATAEGIIDPDFCVLINTANVQVGDDGEISGVAEAIAALKASKPNLFGNGATQVVGTPAPGVTTISGYKSWDDYKKAPEEERNAWAIKNPQHFQALANRAIAKK